jgi:putative SOS response-associated peptidase YedK
MRWGLIPSWAKGPSIGNQIINARAAITDREARVQRFSSKSPVHPALDSAETTGFLNPFTLPPHQKNLSDFAPIYF